MDRNTHSFSVYAATVIGVNAAIILGYIDHWCHKNELNNRHYHEGCYWTYNSVEAFAGQLPYLSKKAIRGALKKLEDDGYILVGTFNKTGYNHTKWYAITESGICLLDGTCLKGQNDVPKKANGIAQKGNSHISTYSSIPVQTYIDETEDQKGKKVGPTTDDEAAKVKEVLAYFNEKTGRNLRYVDGNIRVIRARLREGYTLDDFRRVIDVKYAQWNGDPKMRTYLRPQTLFSTKFDSYLNEDLPEKKADYSQFDQSQFRHLGE